MQAQVDDRLIVHGAGATRIGVIVEVVAENRYRVRWNDGHESIMSPGPDATVERDEQADALAEWEAAKEARHARTMAWRRGITAGVGREAHLAQEALSRRLASGE
jgi:hypothetical protein